MDWKFFIAGTLWMAGCACILLFMPRWWESITTIVLLVLAMFIAMDVAINEPTKEEREEDEDGQA